MVATGTPRCLTAALCHVSMCLCNDSPDLQGGKWKSTGPCCLGGHRSCCEGLIQRPRGADLWQLRACLERALLHAGWEQQP